jgi:hypothetical protein
MFLKRKRSDFMAKKLKKSLFGKIYLFDTSAAAKKWFLYGASDPTEVKSYGWVETKKK